ncbi:hypothetical protein BDF21DRAFT_497612 [Thamnidium elegans]|nr:hypothetical protein BDF21DRAFT_497612 [Thamnidium elegans]
MNALITSSLRIDQETLPEVGSSTLQFMSSKKTKIFILQSQLDATKKAHASDTSGYMTHRASSPLTNYHNLKPYTKWTINNYDDKSTTPTAAKLGSELFQHVARSNIIDKITVKKSEVEELYTKCNDGKLKNSLNISFPNVLVPMVILL